MTAAFLSMFIAALNPPMMPLKQERLAELMKKLEVPAGSQHPNFEGPPDPLAKMDFRLHWREAGELVKAGKAVRPQVLALAADRTKSGQARAHAGYILVRWHLGTGLKQPLDREIADALKFALKEDECAIKWCILNDLWMHSPVDRALCKRGYYSDKPRSKNWIDYPESYWEGKILSNDAMDAVLPEVIALLQDKEPRIAALAANLIYNFARPGFGKNELIAALDHTDHWVRAGAHRALSMIAPEDADAAIAIAKTLDREQSIRSLIATFDTLAKMKAYPKSSVTKIENALRRRGGEYLDPDRSQFHDAGVQALGAFGFRARWALPLLHEFLDSHFHPWDGKTRAYFGTRSIVLDAIRAIDPEEGKKAEKAEAERVAERERMIEIDRMQPMNQNGPLEAPKPIQLPMPEK